MLPGQILKDNITANNGKKRKLALERGRRVKLARTLANVTRKDIWERYRISINTVHAWENGTNCLTEKGALKLLQAFRQEGLTITKDWLLHGGDHKNTAEFNLEEPEQVSTNFLGIRDDIKILEEINYFRTHNADSISMMIFDEALSPFFNTGDYVGGINLEGERLKALVGEFCIVTMENEELLVRKIFAHQENNLFVMGSINPFAQLKVPDYFTAAIRRAAPITRHWHISKVFKTGI